MPYIELSIIAVAGKLAIVALYYRSLLNMGLPLLIALLCVFCLNVIELIGYQVRESFLAYPFLVTYYVFSLLFSAMLFTAGLLSSGKENLGLWWKGFVLTMAVIVILCLTPGIALDGMELTEHTAIAIPGKLYPIVSLGILLPMISGSYLSYFNWRKQGLDSEVRLKAGILFWSQAPIVSVALFVISAKLLGFKTSTIGYLSIATTLMMVVMLYIEVKYGLFKFFSKLPGTKQRKTTARMIEILHSDNLQKAKEDFKNLMIDYHLHMEGSSKRVQDRINTDPAMISRFKKIDKE